MFAYVEKKMIRKRKNGTSIVAVLLLLTIFSIQETVMASFVMNKNTKVFFRPSSFTHGLSRGKDRKLYSASPSSTTATILVGGASVAGQDPDRAGKVNQDRYFHFEYYVEEEGEDQHILHVLGVMDGHGRQGHLLTEFLKDQMPKVIQEELRSQLLDVPKSGRHFESAIEHALSTSFSEVQALAERTADVPAFRSGSTCVVCIVDDKNGFVISANVGDSMAILGQWLTESIEVTKLTIPTVASRNDERNRVNEVMSINKDNGARIDSMGNLWFGPVGVAMTRALGDSALRKAGLISKPEISLHRTDASQNAAVLLGTDGIFDVMSAELALDYIKNLRENHRDETFDNNADSAALQLVLKSRELWQNGLPIEVKIDDSTCVLFSRFMTP